MARSANRGARDGDSRVTAATDRGEVRDLSEPRELSLEEVLKSYEQPINEEQAWAVCYQCCRGLRVLHPPPGRADRVKDPSSLLLYRDGTVANLTPVPPPSNSLDLVQSLGMVIYQALDWGLDDSEERELSPQLERLIEKMVAGVQEEEVRSRTKNSTSDEGYSGQEEEEEEQQQQEGTTRPVRTFRQVMALCASRLANPSVAPEHYQAVCRALFVETLELQTFLTKIRDAKELLKKISTEESPGDRSAAELDALKHTDWARLWVQLMKELRQGVKLKKVQEQPFNPLPTEFSLTPFEMLMQDIRARNFQLRKVMVDGDIPTRVKRNAHELILDFIRSRPPLKPVSERSLPPPPPQQQCLHDRVLAEIKQERKLRPVGQHHTKSFGSLPCLAQTRPCDVKSTSCIDLFASGLGPRPPTRPRVLLKAPTLAEMEEMNISEVSCERLPCLKRSLGLNRAVYTQCCQDLFWKIWIHSHLWFPAVRNEGNPMVQCGLEMMGFLCSVSAKDEFSHPVESLALTVDEVINVRRVLVKAEMEKFFQSKELYNNLKRGKVRGWQPFSRSVPTGLHLSFIVSSSPFMSLRLLQMKIPSKKMAHIPVYTVGFQSPPKKTGLQNQVYKSLRTLSRHSVETEFPHLYAHGCTLRDVCAECTKFVADIISSSRRSVDILYNTPKKEAKAANLYIPAFPLFLKQECASPPQLPL
uniref:Spire-type actin nucleation factor 2 n=1 Tax=Oryzias latipes TaxID=8090 RepID=A0A3P9H552_ORYLA